MEMMNVQASAAGTWLFVAGVNLLESERAGLGPR